MKTLKTIVFFTSKGGGGKSTGGMTLAATLAYHMKKKVLLVSTDPQHTPMTLREEDLQEFPDRKKAAYEMFPCTGDDLLENLYPDREEMAKAGLDYLIVDTIGTMDADVLKAVAGADLGLMPVKLARPDLADFFGEQAELVRTGILPDNSNVWWYPNEYDKRYADWKDFEANYKDFERTAGFGVIPEGLVLRAKLKRVHTLTFPDEEDQVRETFINFTNQVLSKL